MSELKPCPFCGGQPKSGWQGTGVPGMDDCGYWGIDCCNSFAHADDEEAAAAAWNRRTPQPVTPAAKVLCHRLHQPNHSGAWISGDYTGPEMTQRGFSVQRAYAHPVTPAGGEVGRLRELIGQYWDIAYSEGCDGRITDTPAGDAAKTALEIESILRSLSHPPVADAALVRDAERYRFLRNDALYCAYASSGLKPMPWCAIGMDKRNFRLAEKEDLDAAIDAALNQRGGDHG